MKKKLLGFIGVLLVFGFVFMGCPTDTPDKKEENKVVGFEGTWSQQWKDQGGKYPTYIFTGNAFTCESSSTEMSGTFSFTDTNITFTLTSGGSGDRTTTYQFKKNDGKDVLHIERIVDKPGVPFGDYIKQ